MSNAKPVTTFQIMNNSQEFGPYTESEIVAFVQQGHLTGDSFIKASNLEHWGSLSSTLPGLFTAPRPPLPLISLQTTPPARAGVPEEALGWSWSAFFWGPIWSLSHGVWLGLLSFVPYLGIIVAIYMGLHGRRLAWQAGAWRDVAHMQRSEAAWDRAGMITLALLIGFIMIGIGMVAMN